MLAQRAMVVMAEPLARLVWSVSALLQAVADALLARFGACVVRGEISGFARAPSGHCYFALQDGDGAPALLRCVMFRRAATLLDFAPADGMLIELRGRLALYESRGELQMIVEAMSRAGDGALLERLQRLKAKLQAEGLFDAGRKRPLPRFVERVGIVTSIAGAALHDVLTALERRAPQVQAIVYPSPVQGAEAAAALASAIALAGRRCEVDLLIVCRGGGALEDLWAFNDERVVRAIVASLLPVLCGVGHETDVTLADFAADLRAPTPTAAAEIAAPQRDELFAGLVALAMQTRRAVNRRLEAAQQRLDHAALRLARPADRLAHEGLRLRLLAQQLCRAGGTECSAARHRLQRLELRLRGLDPQRVVARGYAIVETGGGELVVDPAQIGAGTDLRVSLAHGIAELRVQSARRA
jgi:exodeoxyribonuclease VII large subunit